MSEQALPIAVRADESAKAAHKRLDGINGSIDRFNRKIDDLDEKADAQFRTIDSKVNSILLTLATQAGADGAKSGVLESKRFWLVLVAGVCTSSVAVLVITLLLRRPG